MNNRQTGRICAVDENILHLSYYLWCRDQDKRSRKERQEKLLKIRILFYITIVSIFVVIEQQLTWQRMNMTGMIKGNKWSNYNNVWQV